MRRFVTVGLFSLPIVAAIGGWAFVRSGYYDVSATGQHLQPIHSLLETTMHHAVRRHAAEVVVPVLADATLVARGGECFVAHCVQCHGGPGVAQDPFARSMQPIPGPLVDVGKRWRPQELYWITSQGIKMSGMPAWKYRLAERDLWALVAFVQARLPALNAAEMRAIVSEPRPASCSSTPAAATAAVPAEPADAERGRTVLTQYACHACHRIPGVTGSDVHVGPPLAGFADRKLIAGAVPNNNQQLVRWLRNPQAIDPQTTMPNLQVELRDARDMAAYLSTLH